MVTQEVIHISYSVSYGDTLAEIINPLLWLFKLVVRYIHLV